MTPTTPGAGRTLFLHLSKTGGTTLRDALTRALPPGAMVVDALDPDALPDHRDAIRRYLEGEAPRSPRGDNGSILERWAAAGIDLGSARVYAAHLSYGMHEHFPEPCDYVTIVREPVARVRSLYRHRVAVDGLTQTPAEWVAAGRDRGLENLQTRIIAGADPEARVACSAAMLDDAKEHLTHRFAAVGVTERYDDSVVAIFTALGIPLVPVPALNRSTRAAELGSFTPDLLERIADDNRFDLELHRFAGTLLDASLTRFDAPAALRRLRRIDRLYATRVRLYPVRRRLGLLWRSATGRRDRD